MWTLVDFRQHGRATVGQLKMNLRWSTCFIMAMCVHMVQGLSVHFKIPKPFYVALGRELVLEAMIEKTLGEKIFMVTWELSTNTGARRLATYPGKIQEPRISIEEEGATLRISAVQESDFGHYTITVTDGDGRQKSAGKDIEKNVDPPDASVSLLCGMSGERTQWDSPVVTWFVDGVELTNQTANMSNGGSRLHLQDVKGHNYTCISDSSQGTAVAYFIIPVPDTCQNNRPICRICWTTLLVAIASIAVATGMVLFIAVRRPGPTT